MVHVLCTNEVSDMFGQNEHKPFAINVPHSICRLHRRSLQTWSVSLLDRLLRVGCVNKRGAAPKSLGTQRNLPTLLLTVRPDGADHQWKEDPLM
jgi:hypothetical protein